MGGGPAGRVPHRDARRGSFWARRPAAGPPADHAGAPHTAEVVCHSLLTAVSQLVTATAAAVMLFMLTFGACTLTIAQTCMLAKLRAHLARHTCCVQPETCQASERIAQCPLPYHAARCGAICYHVPQSSMLNPSGYGAGHVCGVRGACAGHRAARSGGAGAAVRAGCAQAPTALCAAVRSRGGLAGRGLWGCTGCRVLTVPASVRGLLQCEAGGVLVRSEHATETVPGLYTHLAGMAGELSRLKSGMCLPHHKLRPEVSPFLQADNGLSGC